MNNDDPVSLLQALIRCPSVTPAEGGALSLLDTVLAPHGFSVTRPVFQDATGATTDVENLFATLNGGDNAGPHLIFAGHSDVVPPGDPNAWRHDPFAGVLAGERVFGRGAVDMKGAIACFLAAAFRFLEKHEGGFDGRLSVLITGDEEGPAINGMSKLLKWCTERGERFDACILGEPTNPRRLGDMIKIGRRGSLSGTLTVEGVQGHVAYPHLADNPIPELIHLLDALMRPPFDQGSERFQPSNLEVTTIDVGNTALNVIPARAVASFNIRFSDVWSADSLQREIHRRLASVAQGEIRYTVDFQPSVCEAFITEAGSLVDMLHSAVEAETGHRPKLSTSGGTSDARFIKAYCPVVEFGLVGETMHQVDENVTLADIVKLTAIYERFLDLFFASARPEAKRAVA